MNSKAYPSYECLTATFEDIGDTIRWRVRPSHSVFVGDDVRNINGYGYYRVKLKGVEYFVHRILWIMRNGSIDPSMQIDHIDGNRTNNLPENHRLATHSQNRRNMRRSRLNTSGVKGVSWNTASGCWKATIRAGGGNIHLGYFARLDDASAAVETARNSLHGEFANHGHQGGAV